MLKKEDIEYLTQLSRLSKDDASDVFADKISSILGYIGQLEEVDTSSVIETSHTNSYNSDFLREDKIHDANDAVCDLLISNMPQTSGDYLKTKKVL